MKRTGIKSKPGASLKRGAPLKRGTPLKAASPGPTDRSAGREGLRRATSPLRRTELAVRARRAGPTPPEELTLAEALQVPYSSPGAASKRVCKRCRRRKATSWHHWLPQERMRVMMRTVARGEGLAPVEVRRRLRGWLSDDRNLTEMCAPCHGDHPRHFSRRELPLSVWEFAGALDAELVAAGARPEARQRLLRDYKDRPVVLP